MYVTYEARASIAQLGKGQGRGAEGAKEGSREEAKQERATGLKGRCDWDQTEKEANMDVARSH